MKIFVAFLPLLGFVAAQMHNQNMMGQGHGQGMGPGQGMGYGQGMGHGQGGARPNDPFFNDFGAGTSSRTAPPWAAPPRQAAPGPMAGGNVGNAGYGGSSGVKGPDHPAVPFGKPQLANNNPYANADPNAGGGNSGGLAGFGEADRFHAQVEANSFGAQPGGVGGAMVGGAGRGSGEHGRHGGGGGGGMPIGPGLIAGGGFDSNDMQKKSDANEVYSAAASASTIVGVVVAVLIVIGIFALVAVFLVRQRRQSRVVIGSV